MNDCVAQPQGPQRARGWRDGVEALSAVRRAKRASVSAGQPPAPTEIFGKTVKAREGWGPEHQVHLHRYIAPQTIDLAGGRDAIHCRIHTHAAPGR